MSKPSYEPVPKQPTSLHAFQLEKSESKSKRISQGQNIISNFDYRYGPSSSTRRNNSDNLRGIL